MTVRSGQVSRSHAAAIVIQFSARLSCVVGPYMIVNGIRHMTLESVSGCTATMNDFTLDSQLSQSLQECGGLVNPCAEILRLGVHHEAHEDTKKSQTRRLFLSCLGVGVDVSLVV